MSDTPKTRAHSVLGASSAYRWMACPGSVKACEGKKGEDSVYAKEGTAAHEIAEHALRGKQESCRYLLGTTRTNGVKVTEEMVRAVDQYIAIVRGEFFRLASNGNLNKGRTPDMAVEHKFALADLDPDFFGTNDCVIRAGAELHIFDYKHGAGVAVSPERNPQLMYYALGAFMDPRFGDGVESVTLHVVQPRVTNANAHKIWVCDLVDLMDFAADLKAAAEKTRAPDAPLVAGSHCRFCPISATCKAHYSLAMEAVAVSADEIAAALAEGREPKLVAADADMSPEELARRYARLSVFTGWVNKFRDHCKARAVEGKGPAGYKLVDGPGLRIWKGTPTETVMKVAELFNLEPGDVLAPVSVRDVERLVGSAEFPRAKAFVETKPRGLMLVSEKDKRSAADPATVADARDYSADLSDMEV